MSAVVATEAVAIFCEPNPGRVRWTILVGGCPFCRLPHMHWVRALDVVDLLNGEVVRRCHVSGERYRLVEATRPTLRRRDRTSRGAGLGVAVRS